MVLEYHAKPLRNVTVNK